MIYLLFALLIAVVLAPPLIGIRRESAVRGRRESAVAFHRSQIAELEQDRAAALLTTPEYDQALLEVQRRLLTADAAPDGKADRSGQVFLSAILVIAPLLAGLLYLAHGEPWLVGAKPPTIPSDPFMALKQKVEMLPPDSPRAGQGWMLLGRIAMERGDRKSAIDSWKKALKAGFNPYVAVTIAETDFELNGHLSADDEALLRKAIEVEPNGPFRAMVDKRLNGLKTR